MQLIIKEQEENVHFIRILLQHNSRDLRCKEGMESPAKEFQ